MDEILDSNCYLQKSKLKTIWETYEPEYKESDIRFDQFQSLVKDSIHPSNAK